MAAAGQLDTFVYSLKRECVMDMNGFACLHNIAALFVSPGSFRHWPVDPSLGRDEVQVLNEVWILGVGHIALLA